MKIEITIIFFCFISTQALKICQQTDRELVKCMHSTDQNTTCGMFDPKQIQCIRAPCAGFYENECQACLDPKVYFAFENDPECEKAMKVGICDQEKFNQTDACYELYSPVCSHLLNGTTKISSNDCYACAFDKAIWFTYGECSDMYSQIISLQYIYFLIFMLFINRF